jgi:hypothetical protein
LNAIEGFKNHAKSSVYLETDEARKIKNEDMLLGISIENPPSINIDRKAKIKSFSVRSGSK